LIVAAGGHEDVEGVMNIIIGKADLAKRLLEVIVAIGLSALARLQLPSPLAAA
jgi:hypothetical protein